MNTINFIREVKAAVLGRTKKIKPKKINKTPEEIWKEELKKTIAPKN